MTAIRVGDPPPRPGLLARLFPALFPATVPEPGAVIVDATGHTWTWGHGRWLPTWDCKAGPEPEPEAGG
jgi:hypothetical protein